MIKKIFGHFFSVVFVPILLPLYATLYIIYYNPYAFPDHGENMLTLIRVGLLTAFFPAFTVLLLVALKFAKSFDLRDQQDRVVPYVASMLFYIWAFYVFYKEEFNALVTFVLLGSLISVVIAFMVTILSFKVSMHAAGAGGMVATVLFLVPFSYYNSLPVLLITIIIAGCVGTARLVLNAHTQREVMFGYLIGFLSFCIAFNFYYYL